MHLPNPAVAVPRRIAKMGKCCVCACIATPIKVERHGSKVQQRCMKKIKMDRLHQHHHHRNGCEGGKRVGGVSGLWAPFLSRKSMRVEPGGVRGSERNALSKGGLVLILNEVEERI